MNDNPFAEPDDTDQTQIMPRPPVARPGLEIGTEPDRPAVDGVFRDLPPLSASPIVAAAAPLLSLLARLHNVVSVPDVASLRGRAILGMRGYEQELRDRKVPLELIRASHYALCASLDDVVQNTPWGSHGCWADASLVATFHGEVRSGERFFDLLAQLCRNAGKFLPVVELMYLCVSLGMRGRYRLSPRGPAELDRVREETYLVIIRQRGTAERALSPHWQGVSAPYKPVRFELPIWLASLIAAGLLGLAYVLVLLGLNADSDRSFARGLALPPTAMPAIVRPAPPKPLPPSPEGAREKLASVLAADVRDGTVSIVGTDAVPIIRLPSAEMFASGSAVIEERIIPVLTRVAAALRASSGPIRVMGYTDSQPIHTVAFPSNYQLARARAGAAGLVLARSLDPSRITEEGRADADPIGSNATAAGRQQNRRIDIAVGGQETPR